MNGATLEAFALPNSLPPMRSLLWKDAGHSPWPGGTKMPMSFTCPQCADTNTQRLAIAYESGFANVTAHSTGPVVGFGSGGVRVGVGSATTVGTSQTALSQRAAPPEKASRFWAIVCFVLSAPGVFLTMLVLFVHPIQFLFHGGFVALLNPFLWLGYFLNRKANLYNKNEWPPLWEKWNKRFVCLRCGHIFEIKAEAQTA